MTPPQPLNLANLAREIHSLRSETSDQFSRMRHDLARLETAFETAIFRGNGQPSLVVRVTRIEERMKNDAKARQGVVGQPGEPVPVKLLVVLISSVSALIGALIAAGAHIAVALIANGG